MKRVWEPYIERTLKAWAKWVRQYAPWTGWGGGVDNALADAGWGRGGSPGSYSNPVLAEAALHQFFARIHAEIADLPTTERRVLVARYLGRPIAVPRGDEDAVRIEIDVPPPEPVPQAWAGLEVRATDLTVANRHRAVRRMAIPSKPNVCWIDWEWSGGPLSFSQMARLLGLSPSTCHDALNRAKFRLELRLSVRDEITSGRFSPDGEMDPAKLERARARTQQGRTWLEEQEEEEDAA